MIPVVALDPATLTLNFDAQVFHPSTHPTVTALFEAACSDRPQACMEVIEREPPGTLRDIYASFASSVWHEKRHFLDLLLTNYGAFRLRHFFQVYCNLGLLMEESKQAGSDIHCPIRQYLDPFNQKYRGLVAPPVLSRVAETCNIADAILNEDALVPEGVETAYHIGGEGQLEALAFYCQLAAVQVHLGYEGSESVSRELSRAGSSISKYQWATRLSSGLWPETPAVFGKIVLFNTNLIIPLLMASLMIRSWGQGKTVPKSEDSLLPSNRLGLLAREVQKSSNGKPDTVEEGWNIVDQAAEALWGRSIMEELEADFAYEGDMLETMKISDHIPEGVTEVFGDYHALRGSIIELFRKNPAAVLDPLIFASTLLPQLRPLVVVTYPWGIVGAPAGDTWSVYGYRDPQSKLKAGRWYWSTMDPRWPAAGSSGLGMKAPQAWLKLTTEAAPIAKVLLNGNRYRTAVGPEMVFAKQFAAGTFGVNLLLDPMYAFPSEDTLEVGRTFRAFRPGFPILCDKCRAEIHDGDPFHTVSPWFFRYSLTTLSIMQLVFGLNPKRVFEVKERRGLLAWLARKVTDVLSRGTDERAKLRSWRDWSYWVLCESCIGWVLRFPDSESAWYATTTAPMPTRNANVQRAPSA